MPLDKATLASQTGLLPTLIPPSSTVEKFNAAHKLKLGPPTISDKLKEEVARTVQDEAPNGQESNAVQTNGHAHDANGDVEMSAPVDNDRPDSPTKQITKLEPSESVSDLVSPEPTETIPPQPQFYKMADVRREVEAIRDKRKMVRLGPEVVDGKPGSSSSVALPSILAFTVFNQGEGSVRVPSILFSC